LGFSFYGLALAILVYTLSVLKGVLRLYIKFSYLSKKKLPKKSGAVDLKDFRSISLVSGVYKIIAKVLANRLRKVVEKVGKFLILFLSLMSVWIVALNQVNQG
jgi:hypothetical protein